MKGKLNKLFILILMVVLVAVGIAGAASVSKAALAVNPGDTSWSALERVPRFLKETERAGFKWQEGKFSFYDLIKATCEGKIFSALGNNPWPNAYFSLQMPNPEEAELSIAVCHDVADEAG